MIEPELMDQPDLDVRRHVRALDALGRANAVSLTAAAIWPRIRAAAREAAAGGQSRRLRVLDIASGGGHVLVALARRARRAGVDADWLGWDRSAVAVDYARTLAGRRGVEEVRFEQANVMRDPMPSEVDVALCTLFLHHLAEPEAVVLLRRLKEAAARRVVVADLRRTWLGGAFVQVASRALSGSDVFRIDGRRSIAAAFTTDEARALAAQAGLAGAEVSEIWPQRWLLTWGQVSNTTFLPRPPCGGCV